jgi:ketosteroid isomerase-like protein
MRGVLILFSAILLAACDRPAAKQDSAAQANAEAELKAANVEYDKALVDGDAAALGRLYTADFQIIDDDAQIHDRAEQIAFMTKSLDLLNAKSDGVRVRILGPDAALLTGRFSGRYRLEGKVNDFTERYTSVWVRDGGSWRIVHEHSSVVPDETEAAKQ